MTLQEWRDRRPRACCRAAHAVAPIVMADGGAGVAETRGEVCLAAAVDGLWHLPMRGLVCGRRHFYGRFQSGQYGATPQPLTLGGV